MSQPEQVIAGVGVDRAERAGADGDLQLVHHLVAGQGGVIGFEVELEVGQQVVGPQEVQAGGGVGIVLVLGRLLGLGLDVERAGEADLLLVVDGHVQEAGEVVELAFHVGVEQGRVAFAAAPEGVAGAAQFVGDFHGLLDLRGGEGEDVEIGAGGRPVHVAGIGEEVGGAPEQLDAGPCLFVLEDLDDLVEVGVAFLEVVAFGGDVAIVKGVEGRAELLEELEGDLGLALGVGDRVAAVVPGTQRGADAERVGERITEGVPVNDGEAEVLLHRFAVDDLVGVVMLELQRVARLGATVLDLGHVGEKLGHRRRLARIANLTIGTDTKR